MVHRYVLTMVSMMPDAMMCTVNASVCNFVIQLMFLQDCS